MKTGACGVVTVGDYEEACVEGYGGVSVSGIWGKSVTGFDGVSVSGDWGEASAGKYGSATAGAHGTAKAGVGGYARVGEGGKIVLSYCIPAKYAWLELDRIEEVEFRVGEGGIKPDTFYKIPKEGGEPFEVDVWGERVVGEGIKSKSTLIEAEG